MPNRVAVVGAGAAGLTAAIRAAEGGAQVTLLNAHPHIGLKILMSGGTRCNVTHHEVTERDFHGGSPRFVRNVLRAFDVDATLAWFEELGVALKLEPTGKYFPVTDDAQTVLHALLTAVTRAGVRVKSGARVIRLERGGVGERGAAGEREEARKPDAGGDGFRLGIQAIRDSAALGSAVARVGERRWPLPEIEPDRWIEGDRVILASGGLSFPRTGSDGTGYTLATALGHTLEPPVPALTPLAAEDPWCHSLQGVTVDCELRLHVGNERVAVTRGSLLFAHFGYSGPPALDLSRHWLRADGATDQRRVTVSFLPDEREETLAAWFVEKAAAEPRASVARVLASRLPERLAAELCREAGVDVATLMSQFPRAARTRLMASVLSRVLPVNGTLGYEKAEVTAGGVSVKEVDSATLESRIVRGLYLCGEILDVEGRLGGFNFQFSWSSGTVAGRAAAST
jgi:predicted flavoprotein YhiN